MKLNYLIKSILNSLGTDIKKPKKRLPPFKKRYELDQYQPISEFEKKVVYGMFAVNKEVYVTAFTNSTHVLRVTATIGSRNKCRASDNVDLWGEKANKLGATHIRQYHNHPDVFGRSLPSSTDRYGSIEISNYLKQWEVDYRSFLVYKSWLGEGKIKEYL